MIRPGLHASSLFAGHADERRPLCHKGLQQKRVSTKQPDRLILTLNCKRCMDMFRSVLSVQSSITSGKTHAGLGGGSSGSENVATT